jgi:ABC-2 type transport system permease protein
MSTAPARPSSPTEPAIEQALHATAAPGARPPRPGPLSAAMTFGWRGMLKIKHVPEQLLDVTITPVLFLLMFTYLFGGAVAGSTSDYLQYLLPGVLAQSVLFTCVYSGVALTPTSRRASSTASGRCPSGVPRRSWAPCSATACATRSPRSSPRSGGW